MSPATETVSIAERPGNDKDYCRIEAPGLLKTGRYVQRAGTNALQAYRNVEESRCALKSDEWNAKVVPGAATSAKRLTSMRKVACEQLPFLWNSMMKQRSKEQAARCVGRSPGPQNCPYLKRADCEKGMAKCNKCKQWWRLRCNELLQLSGEDQRRTCHRCTAVDQGETDPNLNEEGKSEFSEQ